MLCVKCGTKVIQKDNEKLNINVQNKNIEENTKKVPDTKVKTKQSHSSARNLY